MSEYEITQSRDWLSRTWGRGGGGVCVQCWSMLCNFALQCSQVCVTQRRASVQGQRWQNEQNGQTRFFKSSFYIIDEHRTWFLKRVRDAARLSSISVNREPKINMSGGEGWEAESLTVHFPSNFTGCIYSAGSNADGSLQ